MKKYLVAGGAGFIGSHLVERLVAEGNEVTVVDNLCTGSLENISAVLDKIIFVESDICCFDTTEKYDTIFHLASIANPADYVILPLNLLSDVSFGTHRLLEVANECKARFYYFSSSEVYGHQMVSEFFSLSEESYSSIGLLHERSPYFISKMFGEEFVKAYSEMNNLDYIIIRPFNIYGTKMDLKSQYGRVIPNFLKWASDSAPLKINGDGRQTRSFCYINDFLDAVLLLETLSEFQYSVVNIGNPDSISILNLAKCVQSISHKNIEILYENKVEHEPCWRKPDICRINQWIGWYPKTKLECGLKEIYEWIQKRGDYY
ncbi:MAG: NAD-dependent epimerase/dehydratase family protein [Methanosarcinales archaeon]|nr:NAD-dependent epimerase/dehydratase family protein [Methanosarcinales archaeon]